MSAAVAIMPKKKPAPPPKPAKPAPRRVVLQMKGTDEWKDWLDQLSEFLRMPTSTIVDHALIEYARAHGFEPAPPRR